YAALPLTRASVNTSATTGSAEVQSGVTATQLPEFIANFEGVGNVDGVVPPDTNGDVGPSHYVQMVNQSYAVYDKSGNLLLGPLPNNALFAGFGGPCETTNHGDPVVLYDEAADRWMLTQFAVPGGATGFHQCMAISQTPDPTGAFYRYDFFYHQTRLNDYPKYGIWPDAYYMTANEFAPGFVGVGAVAFEREKMLTGQPARMVYFHLGPDYGGLLPADAEGLSPEPGTPNPFTMLDDDAWGISPTDRLIMWDFAVNWADPASSTFGTNLAPSRFFQTAPFDTNMCNYGRNCIPQQGTTAKLDPIADRLMFRAAYRNFGDHASLVLNHTVDAGGDHAGIRWYELRSSGGSWQLHQQSTFAPDAEHRWMASAAIDASGNIAIGYSASSSTIFPSIRMAGRLAGDPLGQLTQSERTLIAGGGAQTSTSSRWGDYSSMSVDPTDGCTFWFTTEYPAQTSNAAWHTRVGAMRFPNCTLGPRGEVTGTVTDAAGSPIAGASVKVGPSATTTANDKGVYRITVPVGEQSVTATAFGYQTRSTTVTVTDGGSVTADFALAALPKHRLSGVVKDGSGHGWPLYARVDVAGRPGGPIFTDPATGTYAVDLPPGDYGLTVRAMYPAYQQSTVQFSVFDTDLVRDVDLRVESTCTAAGYRFNYGSPLFTERFDSGTTPDGWTVVNRSTFPGWKFTDSKNRGNLTGGTGGYAIVDSDASGSGSTTDTDLITPALDLSGFDAPVLRFNSDYRAQNGAADIEASFNGGATWLLYAHWTTASRRGPAVEELSMPEMAGKSSVQIRFRYKAAWAWWWELDNVSIVNRNCDPVPGGLVVGQVTDANTSSGVNGAVVTSVDKPAEKATTGGTPDDTARGDGFFWLYSTLTGSHQFTAAKAGYQPDTATVAVAADGAARADFGLRAGRLTITPATLSNTQTLGQVRTVTTTIRNDGTAPATVDLSERRGAFEILGPIGAPLQLNLVKGSGTSQGWLGDNKPGDPLEPSPYAPPWTNTASYPSVVMDNAMATYAGQVYSVGGVTATAALNAAYLFDPPTNTWTRLADMPAALEKPTAAFIDGRLFVFGGWTTSGSTSNKVYVYDPTTKVWQTRASTNPAPRAAAAVATVNGSIYLVGGCIDANCSKSDLVVRYDPVADTFTQVAEYPVPVAWHGCGGINGYVYCAGGVSTAPLKIGYAYNPSTNGWSPIADLPVDFWGMGVATANGMLLLSTGAINNSTSVTNQGWAYDPAANAWATLPNANYARYRSGTACTFLKVGGSTSGFTPTAESELLPGFDRCETITDVPWLSATPTSTTLQPGQSVTVTVTLDASTAAGVTQPGTYNAEFGVRSNTPYPINPIAVVMNVTAPKDWGKLTGLVTGASCDGSTIALRGATVQVNGKTTWTFTLKADSAGRYAIWAPSGASPVQIIVARDGWIPQTIKVNIKASKVVSTDFVLRPENPC
ncbi:MAG TPA: carboxypeptidase regulatory-like domain-containing protein, partial [Micromonosporaceae bacterium]